MSNIPTCAVRAVVRDSVGGQPIEGAKISARLSSYEVYQGYVVPHLVQGVTDANGECILNLWPNQLGAVESNYAVTILALGKSLKTFCVVPSAPSAELSDIAELPPYDGLNDGSIIVGQALQAVADARAARDAAAASAGLAGASADRAAVCASGALTSQNAAAASELGSASSAVAADASKVAAATSASAATASQADALASKGAAAASKDLAQAWAVQLAVPVEGGDYSAKYSALLAKGYAESIAGGPVYAVNGRTGNVTLTASDVGLPNVADLAPANLPLSIAAANALAKKADLVNGLVPSSQLPSYVDDVLDFDSRSLFPSLGEKGKIYVASDTELIYRWSGTSYIEISPSPGSSDAVPEGSANLYFTAARVRATVLAGLNTATNAAITAADAVLGALGKLQAQITALAAKAIMKDSDTGAAQLPVGTTAQRPATPTKGLFRFNDSAGRFEGANGAAWGSVGGAAGGGSDALFYLADKTLNNDYTIAGNQAAFRPGGLVIADGKKLTIDDGGSLTLV